LVYFEVVTTFALMIGLVMINILGGRVVGCMSI
jgi:Na+/H+-dicarboxylate symporter